MTITSKSDTFTANGRHIEKGTELTVKGIGRVRFLAYVTTDTTDWVDAVDKNRMIRSFKPADIKRVHYKKKGIARV